MRDLLFEIGCEEIPASYIDPALVWLRENARKELEQLRLCFGEISTVGTPRRLVLIVRNLSDAQADQTQEVLGLKAEAAFDAAGQLTQAAKGFLKAKNLDETQAYRKQTPKGEVLAAQVFEKGRPTNELLSEMLPRLMRAMPFPKTMRWETSGDVFARPVRWLLAIFGSTPVSVKFADVESGVTTTGHRFLSPEFIEVSSVEHYLRVMREKLVMLDAEERRLCIKTQADALAIAQGGLLVEDEALLDIVKNLVEYPWPLLGAFESRYLEIPKEILICEMREHQKYFAVQNADGHLLPHFIVVAGSKPHHAQGVADGHARVLRARFEDGSFYYYEDLKHPLTENVAKLERVQFQRELGSVRAKVSRIENVVANITSTLNWTDDQKTKALRAAHLCKADLVSGVVAQFPELQGVMGGHYAEKLGEDAQVVLGVREHYLPRFAADSLPSTDVGCVVSLADKLDTLVGVIGIGKTPKGNADPFALRRAAIAITRILAVRGFRLSLKSLVQMSIESYGPALRVSASQNDEIVAFILGRARGVFLATVTIIDGAMAARSDDLADLSARIDAIVQLQQNDPASFEQLVAALKRAGNIVSKATSDKLFDPKATVDASLLEAVSEKELHLELEKTRQKLGSLGSSHSQAELRNRYVEVMQEIARLKPYVDRFFDDVMVMTDDLPLRQARLALLYRLQSAVNIVADFSRV